MICVKCKGKQGKHGIYSGELLCDSCFCKIIEKRVRREVRLSRIFSKNDRILVLNDGSKEYKIGRLLLKSIIKDLPVEISEKKGVFDINKLGKSKEDRIIVPWSLDKEINLYLRNMFEGKKQEKLGHIVEKKYVKLLRNVMDSELKVFAEINKIIIKDESKTKDEIKEMLEDIEKKYPGSKFSLLKSIDFMEKLKSE